MGEHEEISDQFPEFGASLVWRGTCLNPSMWRQEGQFKLIFSHRASGRPAWATKTKQTNTKALKS